MLLQLVVATAVAGVSVAAVAETGRPAIEAARAWSCAATRQTVELAVVAHLAAVGTMPATLHELTAGDRPELVIPGQATISPDGLTMALDGWSVTMRPSDGVVTASCDVPGPT